MIFPGIPAQYGNEIDPTPPAMRSVTVDVLSNAKYSNQSKGTVTVPEGLGVGKSVKLEISPLAKDNAQSSDKDSQPKASDSKIAVKSYWGSAESIAEGQPKIVEISTAPEDAQVSPDYVSYAQWPSSVDESQMKPMTSRTNAAGTYSLTSNYCGKASVDVAPEQSFLAPIDLIGMDGKADLEKPIKIEWKKIPNAVGYLLMVYGGMAKNAVNWTSSTVSDPPAGLDYQVVKEKDLADYLNKKILLLPDTTSCTIPAGIFKGSDNVMLTMVALGKDIVKTKDGVETQVIVRSTTSVPLYTKPFELPVQEKE